jgi:hypothetical protein
VLIRRHPSNCKATDGGGSGLQFQVHSLADRGDDLYETPPVAVRALLRVEKLPHFLGSATFWNRVTSPASTYFGNACR